MASEAEVRQVLSDTLIANAELLQAITIARQERDALQAAVDRVRLVPTHLWREAELGSRQRVLFAGDIKAALDGAI